MKKNNLFAVFILLFAIPFTLHADENGKVLSSAADCKSNVFSSIQKVCQLVGKVGASCKITSDSCITASQEIFAGDMIELASPGDTRGWNGLGGLGSYYSAAAVCLMRDLAFVPQQKVGTSAVAKTFLGNVTAKQEVGFLSFNKSNGVFVGWHRLQACGPAIGCLDAYTQKFKLTPVKSDKGSSGQLVGQYKILEAHAVDLWAEGLAQGILVALPGIMVPTPIGDIEAKPEFRFGRATGFVVSPFDGNFKSSFADAGLGITSNKMLDVYGRNPGTVANMQSPIDPPSKGQGGWGSSPKGWISQIQLGSRDPDPKKSQWKNPAGVEYPVRPDFDFTTARSGVEKIPNAYLGASVKVAYSPINLIPKVIRDIGCSGIVQLCIDQLEVFAKPTIDVGFMSELHFFESEQSRWNGKVRPDPTTLPIPDLRPENLDQAKQLNVTAASSTAARFALDAGLDFVISLHINTFFTSIDKTLVSVHPRTTIAETIDKGYTADDKKMKMSAKSYASKIMSDKKLFQKYAIVGGADLASGPTDGGANHLKACFAKDAPPGSMPPEPTYTPGDLSLLVDQIEYPCNICIGWDKIDYLDNNKKPQSVPGNLQSLFPASQDTRPAGARWKCIMPAQSGCYDMCKKAVGGSLTVIRTALEMQAAKEATGMPPTCMRGHGN